MWYNLNYILFLKVWENPSDLYYLHHLYIFIYKSFYPEVRTKLLKIANIASKSIFRKITKFPAKALLTNIKVIFKTFILDCIFLESVCASRYTPHPPPRPKKEYLNNPIVLPTCKENSQDQLTGLEFKKSGIRENNLGWGEKSEFWKEGK